MIQFQCDYNEGAHPRILERLIQYFRLSEHAVSLALKIRDAFKAKGYPFIAESPSNQQFPIPPYRKQWTSCWKL